MHDKDIDAIFESLDRDNVEAAVMACLRIARTSKDYMSAAIFMRELFPERMQIGRMISDDASHLKEDAQKYIFEHSLERWLEIHTVDFIFVDDGHLPAGERKNVLKITAGEINSEIEQWNGAIADLTVPPGMSAYDTASFMDGFTKQKAMIRQRIKAIYTIKARLKTRCLNYAVQMQRQVNLQKKSQSFLEIVQNDVNNYFKEASPDVFLKLVKAGELSESSGAEDAALILTEVRRVLSSAADHFYPSVTGLVKCRDGVERKMGNDQYMNRLQEYLSDTLEKSTSKDLLRAELDYLVSFIKRLNEMASKGVHASATIAEAKQGLIGVYFFLYNLLQQVVVKPD